jgi:hypothetical protein
MWWHAQLRNAGGRWVFAPRTAMPSAAAPEKGRMRMDSGWIRRSSPAEGRSTGFRRAEARPLPSTRGTRSLGPPVVRPSGRKADSTTAAGPAAPYS